MKKNEILSILDKLAIDKNEFIIIGETALVLHGLKEDTNIILLSTTLNNFNKINWEYKIGIYGNDCKFFKNVEVIVGVYEKRRCLNINGYFVLDLDGCYDFLLMNERRKNKKLLNEMEMTLCSNNDFYWFEKKLREKNIKFIAGVDEVGRGPLVGPVVAACCVLPENFHLKGLTDSKKLSENKRNYFYEEIKKQALGIGIGIINERKIDEINIYEATKLAMKMAIKECLKECKIEHILIDAMPLDINIPVTSIIKGDYKSITISAASVIAKVTRDNMMYELDKKYPMYDFKENKGYPTKKHLEAIKTYGIINEHRKSYGPVKEYLMEEEIKNVNI